MELSAIYEPVWEDLVKVEDKLRSVSKVDFPHLSELLEYSLGSHGKMIRPMLTLLSGKFYNLPDRRVSMGRIIFLMMYRLTSS